MSTNPKVVLITGASSGLGRATARLLAERGYRVFGTSRRPPADAPTGGVEPLALDVCADASVAACVQTVLARAGRIDALINNAGYELGGALEEATLEEAQRQFETNFFGAVRMIRAVLPAMRRQGGGRIVNVSSLAGLAPVPFLGLYSASKFALEGYSEALRHEVAPFNVKVSLIEPGFLATALAHNRQQPAARIRDYDPWRERVLAALRGFENAAPAPTLAAAAILHALESRAPRLRYVAGKDARRVARLRRLLPQGLFERGTRSHFGLNGRAANPPREPGAAVARRS